MAFVVPITAHTDSRVQRYVGLRSQTAASSRKVDDVFIAEGRLVVTRLIESDYAIESLLIQTGKEAEFVDRLPDNVPIYSMSRAMIREVVGFDFHRGLLACGRRQCPLTIQQYCDSKPRSVSLGLLGISDPENMGSMLRTAAALGIDQVLVGASSIDPFHRRVIRVSMATTFKHRFYQINDPLRDLDHITKSGVRTIASTLNPTATVLDDFRPDDRPMLLLVGNEADGIHDNLQAIVDARVRIPMQFGTDSLNVAVAAALLMYRLSR